VSWRDHLRIHPACELFPPLPPDELRELGEDIKRNRLQERAKVMRQGDNFVLVDGRSRLDAIEVAGLPIQVFVGSLLNNKFFEEVEGDVDPFDYVVSMNIRRRHLTGEQKRGVIAKLLKAKPERSNRQIGKQVGASHHTVSDVRSDLEATGQIAQLDKTTGADGKSRPAHKPSPEPTPVVPARPEPMFDDDPTAAQPAASRKFTGDFEWHTPKKYIEAAREVLGHIGLDPATSLVAQETVGADNFYTLETDGLICPWSGTVWLNPPYAQPLMAKFVYKLLHAYDGGSVKAAILLSSNGTDTEWFHAAAAIASAICFTRGRIKFIDDNESGSERSAPPSGSAFLYFGPDVVRFHRVFAKFGAVMVPWHAGTAVAAQAAE
jgi:DNA N-6-adenine-methyltransferase (Dam)